MFLLLVGAPITSSPGNPENLTGGLLPCFPPSKIFVDTISAPLFFIPPPRPFGMLFSRQAGRDSAKGRRESDRSN